MNPLHPAAYGEDALPPSRSGSSSRWSAEVLPSRRSPTAARSTPTPTKWLGANTCRSSRSARPGRRRPAGDTSPTTTPRSTPRSRTSSGGTEASTPTAGWSRATAVRTSGPSAASRPLRCAATPNHRQTRTTKGGRQPPPLPTTRRRLPFYRAVTSGNPPSCCTRLPGRRTWSCGHGRPCRGTPASSSASSLRPTRADPRTPRLRMSLRRPEAGYGGSR